VGDPRRAAVRACGGRVPDGFIGTAALIGGFCFKRKAALRGRFFCVGNSDRLQLVETFRDFFVVAVCYSVQTVLYILCVVGLQRAFSLLDWFQMLFLPPASMAIERTG
jgi:hypothetical protein